MNVPNSNHIPLTHVGACVWVRVWSTGVCVESVRVFKNQHVGIGETKLLHWGVMYRIETEGEVTARNSNHGRQPKVSIV